MKLLSWNVNGLRAVHKKGFLDWFTQENADIVCVQETKAQEMQLPDELTAIPEYTSYFSSALKKGYSGVACWCKHKPAAVTTSLDIQAFDQEGRVLELDCATFILYNIYFPNGKARQERLDYKMDFYRAVLLRLKKQLAAGKKIILCGDINTAHTELDLSRPKENENTSGFLPQERAWIDALLEAGFIDTLRIFEKGNGHYSWWDLKSGARSRNIGWRIDYFFISKNLRAYIHRAFLESSVFGSDHCPIGIEMRF